MGANTHIKGVLGRVPKVAMTFGPFLLILITVLASGVGGDNADLTKFSDGSNANGYSSLCRVVRNSRKSVLSTFRQQYTASNTVCNITNHCENVNCSTELSRGTVMGGVTLNLCTENPELTYWVDLPGQWEEPWKHTFSSKNLGQNERQEITSSANSSRKAKWFLKVGFIIDGGHIRINQGLKYISSVSVLQVCQNSSEDSCSNTTLLEFPRLPQSQICEFPVLEPKDIAQDARHSEVAMLHRPQGDSGSYPSSTRSSRHANAGAWDPEEVRKTAAKRAEQYQNGGALASSPGDKCNLEEIFGCGTGATCIATSDGSGICQCLPGYEKSSSSRCRKQAPRIRPDPSGQDSLNSRSYSSAIGAIISICVLVAIAGGIFYGIKYNYFARIRHRIPVIRCWPFRRAQPWEDNVTMVNPLGPPDDDDPPLL